MNAFELASFVSGTLINRICDLKIAKMIDTKKTESKEVSFENSEQFTSKKGSQEIVQKVNFV